MTIENFDVSEGQSGIWKIEKFTVSEEQARIQMLRASFGGGRGVPAGTYTRLMRGGTVIMSDTPDEIRDFNQVVALAHGSVLINGLGLGVVLQAILNKKEVNDVTVVEKSSDVIALVGEKYKSDPRVTIINADAFEYKPPKDKIYDVVWHDIWDYITSDNLEGMKKLHRKYGKKSNWQGSWARDICEYQNRQNNRRGYSY